MPYLNSKSNLLVAAVVLAGFSLGSSDCQKEACEGPATLTVTPSNVTVAVGEQATVDVQSTGTVSVNQSDHACDGIASLSYSSMDKRITVRGLALGACRARIDSVTDTELISAFVNATVVASVQDASASTDAGSVLCSVPVAKIGVSGGRDLYSAYTDVDSGPPNQACPIHTSTNYMGDITFSFLGGSPGYTIDGGGNYVIESASPATFQANGPGGSAADALDGDIVTIVFHKRVYPNQDASVAPQSWTMTFRMASDPDPAKWKVELFSFSKL